LDTEKRFIVGVNAYEADEQVSIPILEMDPEGYQRQSERLKQLRATRDNARVGQTLDRLRIAAQGTENLMPYILDAVRAYATLGEMIDVMKDVFGTYDEPTWV
jgi:methylmalonyl-CoA mutase N-terminal domain/subunit